jgi:aminoglycoside 6'-N-acetyltransferase
MAGDYDFRPLEAGDLPMVGRWLREPAVMRWWGDPDEQAALVAEDLAEPRMAQWIVSLDGTAFAYGQDYALASWPQPHLDRLPRETRMIDTFVGRPDVLGRGHGRAYLRLRARSLLAAGAPVVAIDPMADNHVARRAYGAAGFEEVDLVETDEGPAVVMLFRPVPAW